MRVCTTGTFDVPHIGHANFLRQAASLGDLHIGVLSDKFVKEYKGQEPVYPQFWRRDMLGMLGYNAQIIDDQAAYFRDRNADIIAVGSDWRPYSRYLAQIGMEPQDLEDLQASVVFIPYTQGISTSDITARVLTKQKQDLSKWETERGL